MKELKGCETGVGVAVSVYVFVHGKCTIETKDGTRR